MNKIADVSLGTLKGLGRLGEPTDSGISTLTYFISSVIGLMTIIAIIWFVFTFITGAIGVITSGGDKQALESARKKITSGIAGLVIVVIAIFAIILFGYILGFSSAGGILNLNKMFTLIQH